MDSASAPTHTSTQQFTKAVSQPAQGFGQNPTSTIVEPLQVDFPQSALTDPGSGISAQVIQPQIFEPQKNWTLYPWQPGQPHMEIQPWRAPPPPSTAGTGLSTDFIATDITNAWYDSTAACNPDSLAWYPHENFAWQPGPTRSYRCWQHGCDGRSFSSLSNYRRHLRERLGPRARCPRCGQTFVRAAARDEHHRERKCTMIQLDANCVPFRTKMNP